RAAPVIHALSLRSPTSHALLSPMIPPPPSSTLFPYTTLFRSVLDQIDDPRRGGPGDLGGAGGEEDVGAEGDLGDATVGAGPLERDRKSTRLNSSHVSISYAVFCLKKKTSLARHTLTPAVPTSC